MVAWLWCVVLFGEFLGDAIDAFGFGGIWCDEVPGFSHFAAAAEIDGGVVEGELWGVDGGVVVEEGVHGGIERTGDEEGAFDGVGCFFFGEVELDGVGEGAEEVSVLPGSDVIGGGEWVWNSFDLAGEIPANAAIADFEGEGLEAVDIMDADGVGGAVEAIFDQGFEGGSFGPELGGHGGIGEGDGPFVVGFECFPECVAVEELDGGDACFAAAARFDDGLEDFEAMEIVGLDASAVD